MQSAPLDFSQYFGELPEEQQSTTNCRCRIGYCSAAYTPATPIKCGNINANGINRIALRNKAMKIEIFACPKATNIFWQARCNPKIVIPPKKTGIAQRTVSINLSSLVKAEATVEGKRIINNISSKLNENMVINATRKQSLTRCLSPCP